MSVLKGERPIIRSDGTPVRDFIYTEDIVGGYLLLAENIEQAQGEAFNFGSGEPVSMLDLVGSIVRLMGRSDELAPEILLKTKIVNEIDAQYLDSAKVKSRFGWTPKVNIEEGLLRTIDWYKNNWV